ncbi:MAG: hypothetical protein ABI183_07485 [Polyangiaceae bacterium]
MKIARALTVVVAFVNFGCGYALFETGKTVPPHATSFATGASIVSNAAQANLIGGKAPTIGHEMGPVRTGITDHLDVGARVFYVLGAETDAKYNFFAQGDRFALAPRLGGGFAFDGGGGHLFAALVGLITSYDVSDHFTPYVGATWVTHWVYGRQESVALQPGERLASRTGVGDGLLELVGGIHVRVNAHFGVMAEASYWAPMQDDPGDGFVFVPSIIGAMALRYCFGLACDRTVTVP